MIKAKKKLKSVLKSRKKAKNSLLKLVSDNGGKKQILKRVSELRKLEKEKDKLKKKVKSSSSKPKVKAKKKVEKPKKDKKKVAKVSKAKITLKSKAKSKSKPVKSKKKVKIAKKQPVSKAITAPLVLPKSSEVTARIAMAKIVGMESIHDVNQYVEGDVRKTVQAKAGIRVRALERLANTEEK